LNSRLKFRKYVSFDKIFGLFLIKFINVGENS
jgi:hypothetical protein